MAWPHTLAPRVVTDLLVPVVARIVTIRAPQDEHAGETRCDNVPTDTEPPAAVDDPVAQSQRAYITLLFNKYRAPLFRYLTRFVGEDDASELVQETYFRLLRHGNTVQLEAMARSFLFATALNLARDLHRRRASLRAVDHVANDDDDLPVDAVEPSDLLVGEQVLSALERALQRMPSDVRHIFLLYRFREMSYADIGAALGLSTRSVARKMAEAIARLGDAVRDPT